MKKVYFLLLGVLFFSIQSIAQRTVTGKVTDEQGDPMANVSVMLKGTQTGTITKADGTYSILVPANVKTLVFTSVNMIPVEMSIGTLTQINTSLKATDRSLDEVVVTGYGTQRRTDVTGSISSIKGSAIAQKPVQSFESALAGKAAGVQITSPNGLLNNPPVFRIRGTNSISLSSYPLIVIDGVPTYTGDQGGTSAPANALASINPNDIESIDIAKDAASAAIYGSRAANGVVFITTKKGKTGKAKVNYDGWVGFTSPFGLPEVLNAQQYVAFKNVALANLKANVPATSGSFIIPNDANGNPINTNWSDEVYHKGFSQSHSVNVSGGSDGTSYFFSAGYTDQEGILKTNGFKRNNILLNVDSRVNKVISLGGKVSYSNEKNLLNGSSGSLPGETFASAGAARLAFALPPNVSPYKNDGSGQWNIASATAIGNQGTLVNNSNPYTFNNISLLLALNRQNNEVNHMQSNVYFQVKPTNWLALKTVYGIDNLLVDNEQFYNPYHGDGAGTSLGPGGGAISTFSKDKTWLWTNTAQADFTVAKSHNFSMLIGNEQQRRTSDNFGLGRRTLSDSAYTVIQAGFTTNNTSGLGLTQNYLLSAFGRLNYNYNKKYFFSGNIRQDEYSALGVKKGVFWGASGAWEITKENFWSGAGLDRVFSSFKLRGSYGRVGNISGIGSFATFSNYSSGLYGGIPTLAFGSVGNDKITWETSTKTDLGFSFGLFKDRLTGELAYYKNDIDGLLLQVPQSPSTGLVSIFANVGRMYNKGIEVTLNGSPILTKNFSWNSTLTFSYNKNMVVSLADGLTEILTATSLETVSKTVPGKSLGQVWVTRSIGVDPATGRRIYLNKNGAQVLYANGTLPAGQFNYQNPDGTQYKVNGIAAQVNAADDAVMVGGSLPKYTGGWDNSFRYKDFDVNFIFTYQLGALIYYGSNAGLRDMRFWNNSTDVLRYWQKPGDITDIPKPVYGDNVSNGSATPLDIHVHKGDFVKLRTAQIGYSVPKSIINKANISRARLYVSGQNLAIFTKYPGPDPEVSTNGNSSTGQGIDRNIIANGRTITIGLNIIF